MNPRLKKFFAFFMLAADLLLLPFFFMDAMSSADSISWFLTAFFAIDAYLTVDYIKDLTNKIKDEQTAADERGYEYARNLTKAQFAYLKRKEDDKEMAEAIRNSKEVEEMDPDELRELLSSQTVSEFEHNQKRTE